MFKIRRALAFIFRKPYVWVKGNDTNRVYFLRATATPFGALIENPRGSGHAVLNSDGSTNLGSYEMATWVPANGWAKRLVAK